MTTLSDLDPTLDKYIIYEEYPTVPNSYTLNGFMYTLIGLYDWSCVESPSKVKAEEMFKKGCDTLEVILPYFDTGWFTAYDLTHITMLRRKPHIVAGYHCEHVAFCKIFYDITGIEQFNTYYQRWKKYVDWIPRRRKY